MRLCGVSPRRIKTLGGEVAYERPVYECPQCRRSAAPLDRELGVEPGDKISRGLARKMAWSAAHHGFADAAADVLEMTGIEVSVSECRRTAMGTGQRMEKSQREAEALRLAPVSPERPAPPPEIQAERLVIQADAGSVLTRADEEHKMVWCGRAFALEDRQVKTTGQQERRFIEPSRHTVGTSDMEDFGPRLKALGWRMGMRRAKQVAFVADGQACLWKWAEDHLAPGTILIQDYWHVSEHLADLAKALSPDAAQAHHKWESWKTALWESRVDDVLEELRHEHKKRRGALRQAVAGEITYLENGRARMDYKRYREEGWPVGSGAIEADCKHLIKERMGVVGARWRRANIAPILALRVAIFNQEWEEAWSRN
jgi:hypothetical protein